MRRANSRARWFDPTLNMFRESLPCTRAVRCQVLTAMRADTITNVLHPQKVNTKPARTHWKSSTTDANPRTNAHSVVALITSNASLLRLASRLDPYKRMAEKQRFQTPIRVEKITR